MVSTSQISKGHTLRRIWLVQIATIIWMSVEAGVSLGVAYKAHSAALLAFGGDSAIELLSAVVVLRHFNARGENAGADKRTARIAGTLLFALAAYVISVSMTTLLGHYQPRPTYLGIAVLIAAAAIMPWLAREKRKLSVATASAALRADAAQSGVCTYLSMIALAGLGANAIWHIRWADPVAALAITPLILWEAKEAIRGKACCDC